MQAVGHLYQPGFAFGSRPASNRSLEEALSPAAALKLSSLGPPGLILNPLFPYMPKEALRKELHMYKLYHEPLRAVSAIKDVCHTLYDVYM